MLAKFDLIINKSNGQIYKMDVQNRTKNQNYLIDLRKSSFKNKNLNGSKI